MKSILSLLFCLSIAHAQPEWANTDKVSGNSYFVSCYGEGPALDVARIEAKKSCLASATFKSLKLFNVKTLTVETETDAGLHQEVSSDTIVSGLDCEVEKESVTSTPSQFKTWILCKFNLSKVRYESKQSQKHPIDSSVSSSEFNHFNLNIVPKCDSIMFEGESPRILKCAQNPIRISLKKEDRNLIIRALGYKPKTIQASEIRSKGSSKSIILEELNK